MSDFYNKYPYTDFHELNLDWIIERVKQLTEDWLETKQAWENTEADWQELYDYVHDYFDNLDVQQEINNKINAMIADGTFVTITTPVIEAKVASMMPTTVASQIGDTVASQIGGTVATQLPGVVSDQIGAAVVSPVNSWLAENITQPTTPVVDTSLSIAGAAADAAVTGYDIRETQSNLELLFDNNVRKFLSWNYGYIDGSDGSTHTHGADNPNRYTDLIYLEDGFTIYRDNYAKRLYVHKYDQYGTWIGRVAMLETSPTSAHFNIIDAGYYRLSQELQTIDATISFDPNTIVYIQAANSIPRIEQVLNENDYIIPMSWEAGYINSADGSEGTNTVDSRTVKPVFVPKNSRIVYAGITAAPYVSVYNSVGTWIETLSYNSFIVKYGYYTSSDLYCRLTATDSNGRTNTTLTQLNSEYATYYCYFVTNTYYDFITDSYNRFLKPTYEKVELVEQRGAPVCYWVDLIQDHIYDFKFKSSQALNQASFYLQIWQTEITDISEGGVLIKNFGDVWSTSDTSTGLTYRFRADANYSGYMRFGYYATPVSSGIIAYEAIFDITEPSYFNLSDLDVLIQSKNLNDSYWTDKKIVWFGTSIPAGVINPGDSQGAGSYPARLGNMLNATVYNESLGSSAARIGMHGSISASDPNGYAGVPATCCLYSLSGTRAEKQDILDNWGYWQNIFTQGVSDIDPSNPDQYLDASYETKLSKYLSGGSVGTCDLYVFDHGYNDAGNLNGSDYSDTTDVPVNPLDRTYFIGAMNFLIDQIKSDDYHNKVIIISHYNDEGAFADLIEAQSYIANKWNIPFINISNKLGFSTTMSVTINGITKTLKNFWLPDTIHPASDTTGRALQHYAEVLYPMIRDVR